MVNSKGEGRDNPIIAVGKGVRYGTWAVFRSLEIGHKFISPERTTIETNVVNFVAVVGITSSLRGYARRRMRQYVLLH